jgi:anti-sigma factor RsiW
MTDPMTTDPQTPEAELARLADGSLDPKRQDELRAQIQKSPALVRALAEQERAVKLLRSTSEIAAPDALRAQLDALVAEPSQPAKPANRKREWPRLRLGFALPAMAAVAAAVVAAVLIIGGNGSSGPTLPQAAQAALSASTLPAPADSTTNPAQLDVSVGGIPFPDWSRNIGWRTLGQRNDTLGGRRVVTVFYASHKGTRIGYAIVSGAPINVSGDTTVHEGGTTYTLFNLGNARGITWRREGHTCVIAGRGVSDAKLLALAGAESDHTVASWDRSLPA